MEVNKAKRLLARKGESFHQVVIQALRSRRSAEQSPEQDIEDKFGSLALAFRTDRMTLDRRIELHERARNIAEQNIVREMDGVREALKVLESLSTDSQSHDIYSKLQHHIDVLELSTSRMSSRAEVLGAVQQECRISLAIDVMLQHVDNLKQTLDKEHLELEETKKLLQESKSASGIDGDKRAALAIAGGMMGAKKTLKKWRNRKGELQVTEVETPAHSDMQKKLLEKIFAKMSSKGAFGGLMSSSDGKSRNGRWRHLAAKHKDKLVKKKFPKRVKRIKRKAKGVKTESVDEKQECAGKGAKDDGSSMAWQIMSLTSQGFVMIYYAFKWTISYGLGGAHSVKDRQQLFHDEIASRIVIPNI